MKKILDNKWILGVITLVVGVLIGWLISKPSQQEINLSANQLIESPHNQIWTCSMHPQIRQPEPGQCPICGMDLILLNDEFSSDENPMEIKMSPTAMQLANVQTSIITKKKPIKQIRINGKVKADERNVFSQSSHIPGRIEKLMVSFTGESVQQGQALAYVYSPELVTAQEELLEAHKIKEAQPGLYQAAREKLKNWKLTEMQINQLIKSGVLQEQFPILADVSGIVLTKKINLGDYIKKGQSIYEIANLNTVWVLFDVYESDISWVKIDDKINFSVQSLPGELFTGTVSFIDPVINAKTRVASARVEINNPGMRLKLDMFVQGTVESPIQNQKEALVVPKSAVMWTGERSVVYVKNTNAKGVSFKMREVVLGSALGDSYVIKEGIEEGEEIATNGTFSIDAAAQLAGKPSMMNLEGGVVMTEHNYGGAPNNVNTNAHSKIISISKKAKDVLLPLYNEYLLMKNALVADDFEKSKQIAASLLRNLNKTNMGIFIGEAHNVWMQHSNAIEKVLQPIDKAKNIGEVRKYFQTLSDQFIMLAITFGSFEEELYIQHCPMANDNKGADWISNNKTIKNPYFGASMIGCGEVTKEIK